MERHETGPVERVHQETFCVRPTDCDLTGRMRPDALFAAMQEGGEHHAQALGFGYEALRARGLFFVLSRIHVRIERAPGKDDRVVHTTWPGTVNRFFFPRFHTFTLEDGTPLAQAGGLWVLLSEADRRVVPPAKAALSFPDNSDLTAPIDLPLRLPASGANEEHFTRMSAYSDFDVNGHVNNTRYIAWLCDALGAATLSERALCELTAGYEREIRGEVPLTLALSREGGAFTFRVLSAEGEKHFVAGGALRAEAGA